METLNKIKECASQFEEMLQKRDKLRSQIDKASTQADEIYTEAARAYNSEVDAVTKQFDDIKSKNAYTKERIVTLKSKKLLCETTGEPFQEADELRELMTDFYEDSFIIDGKSNALKAIIFPADAYEKLCTLETKGQDLMNQLDILERSMDTLLREMRDYLKYNVKTYGSVIGFKPVFYNGKISKIPDKYNLDADLPISDPEDPEDTISKNLMIATPPEPSTMTTDDLIARDVRENLFNNYLSGGSATSESFEEYLERFGYDKDYGHQEVKRKVVNF